MYIQRRQKLKDSLGTDPIVISAFHAVQQTNDASAPFIQESHFLWLTGINEPGWKLIIDAEGSTLVAPGKTDVQRIFDGGLSADEAQAISGVDAVIEGKEFAAVLEALAKKHKNVFTILKHPHAKYFDFALNPAAQKVTSQLKKHFPSIQNCRGEIAKLKAIKSPEEIAYIQQAIAISVDGFNEVYTQLAHLHFEYEAEAALSYAFRRLGAEGHAYQPIVAEGKNACTLHYIENNSPLPKSGLLLIDAGARVGGYAADITRTYAIGSVSEREKAVHAEVEKAHKAIIELIKPGLSFTDYHKKVDVIMKQAIQNLGLLKKPSDYRKYFPHAVSHGLGLDVHDSLGGYDTFQVGMVLTVEPGIYILEEGIGVRIEDDILVTASGNENLSAALPTSL